MRFGICAPPEQTAELVAAGYDYVEWPVNRTVGTMDDAAYAALRRLAAQLPVRSEARRPAIQGRAIDSRGA